ncbi:MAG: alkaline phosphatase family protein [Alphaproteobacteria bacterium]|nr:alkaline phosphatase family protein [Alphaproteobacteria bacterium]
MTHHSFTNGKVLIVVFDGLRPDRVTADAMPHLHRFLGTGARFTHTASAFPSETRVQVSTVMSGHPPASRLLGHGIMGNAFYDPALGFDGPMDTSDDTRMRAAEQHYGRLFGAAHLSEILAAAGKRYAAVTTGKIGNARLLAGRAAELGQPVLSIHGDAVSTPAADFQAVTARFGPCPEMAFPNTGVTAWATRALLDHMIPVHDPDLAVLWLNEPDLSYHYRGITSPEAAETLAAADAAFGSIHDWWEAEGRAKGFRLLTMSDHGHITVEGQIDVKAELAKAGLRIGSAIGPDTDYAIKPGYSGHIAVRDGRYALVARLLETLTDTDWCGPLFTKDRHIASGADALGALPMARINYAHPRAADLAFTLRTRAADWTDPDGNSSTGVCLADNPDIPIGGGLHGGLHPGELTHLLAFGGDGISAGLYETPSGNVDVGPTALALLGLPPHPLMAGRALAEAFEGETVRPEVTFERLSAGTANGYAQTLQLAAVLDAGEKYNSCWYLRDGFRVD